MKPATIVRSVICPYCSAQAELVDGTVVYPRRADLADKRFWRCEPCAAWVGCHPAATRSSEAGSWRGGQGDGTVPMGRLANAELRRAKQAAHAAFDPLWKGGPLKRREAYQWLADQLDIPFRKCHIGELDVTACAQVVAICLRRHNEGAIT